MKNRRQSSNKKIIPAPTGSSAADDTVSRKCAHCTSIAPPVVHDVLNSSVGKPMDTGTRSFMEQRFNYDFSNVKIHDHDIAAKSAGSINALAYTSGNNIVFNSGQYNTGSDSGKRLLAHELTHVVQQNGQSENMIQREPDSEQADDPCSFDKIWGFGSALQETLCHMKCNLPFTGKDCDKECDDKYSYWQKLKRCRKEHPLPPPPDIWNETE